jgi:hypothetical protein
MLNLLNRCVIFSLSKNVPASLPTLLNSQSRYINYVSNAMPELEEEGKDPEKKKHWLTYNDKIFPPQSTDEERRPAVCSKYLFLFYYLFFFFSSLQVLSYYIS